MADHVNELPDELLIQVFSHFKPDELRCIALVCKRWHELSKASVLWKSFVLNLDSVSPLTGRKLLKLCPLLDKLEISDGHGFTSFWKKTPELSTLRELWLPGNHNLDEKCISMVLSKCPSIETLDLSNCQKVNLACINSICTVLPNVQGLILSGCKMINDDCVMAIATSCHNLKRLDLSGISHISDTAVCELTNRLHQTLQDLSLESSWLHDISMNALSECNRLKCLKLLLCHNLTEQSLQAITSLPDLRALTLDGRENGSITKNSYKLFLQGLNGLNQLKVLNLPLDDSNLKTVTDSWKGLRELSISETFVSDRGLATVVCNCVNLRTLTLSFMDMVTGDFLAAIPPQTTNLRRIIFIRCLNVKDSAKQLVTRNMPNLNVSIVSTI